MTPKETLAYWIVERDAIYRRKTIQGYDAPWSEDLTFQRVYFCNVRRENDRVTKWIREHYTPDFFGGNYELAIVAARIFNRPETLLEIANTLIVFNPDKMLDRIMSMQAARTQVWSGAYLISTCGAKMPKSVYCVNLLEEADRILPLTAVTKCAEAHRVLMMVDGLGSFLAAQIVADLKNTKGHNLHNALDRDTFSAHGPGSLRGLGWFHERKATPSTYEQDLFEVRDWLLDSEAHAIVNTIDNQDLQNCLCEYDKYMRVSTGVGRSKRKYKGY